MIESLTQKYGITDLIQYPWGFGRPNRMLFEFVWPEILEARSETELLKHIKSMRFAERYKKKCFAQCLILWFEKTKNMSPSLLPQTGPPLEVSYVDNMVSQRLIAGLSNQEHQRRVLSEVTTLITLQQKVEPQCVLETTNESTLVLQGGPVI